MEVKPVLLNMSYCIVVKFGLLGRVTDVKSVQSINALFPMVVTVFGMVTPVMPVPWNAPFPMLVTAFGIVIVVIPVFWNALSPMAVTELSNTIVFTSAGVTSSLHAIVPLLV